MLTITKIPSPIRKPKSRAVQQIAEQMPVREWLVLQSACSFAEMGVDAFKDFALENKLTISGGKKSMRFLVSEINAVFAKQSFKPA